MGLTQGPCILQLSMGPSYFAGSVPPDPHTPLFCTLQVAQNTFETRNAWQSPGWLARSCAVGATWRIRLNDPTSFSPTYSYDIHTKFLGGLICRFHVMISALLQDGRHTTTHSMQRANELSCECIVRHKLIRRYKERNIGQRSPAIVVSFT